MVGLPAEALLLGEVVVRLIVSPGESKPATLRRELHITYSIWFKGKTGLFARLLFWMESTAVIVFLGWFDRAGFVGLFPRLGG